jgi:hypothetical protein
MPKLPATVPIAFFAKVRISKRLIPARTFADSDRNAAPSCDGLVDGVPADFGFVAVRGIDGIVDFGNIEQVWHAVLRNGVGLGLCRCDFEIECVAYPAKLVGCVDDGDFRANCHGGKQRFDILRIHADAAMAGAFADAVGSVGAVNGVARPVKAHRVIT